MFVNGIFSHVGINMRKKLNYCASGGMSTDWHSEQRRSFVLLYKMQKFVEWKSSFTQSTDLRWRVEMDYDDLKRKNER